MTAAARTLSVARPVRAEMLMNGIHGAKAMRLLREAMTSSRFCCESMRSHLLRRSTMPQPRSTAMLATFWSCSVTPTVASTTSRQMSARSIACRPRTRL